MTGSAFDDLTARRRSVRGFLPDPAPRAVLERLIAQARSAPSGANLQPGLFHVLTGRPLQALSDALLAAEAEGRPTVSEYSYFPPKMTAEQKRRQRAAGFALYDAIGVTRRDVAGRRAQFSRNYRFFDAPVGVVVTIERDMGSGCFMDLGMALQTLFLAAENAGLGACGIGALANYGDLVHAHLGLPQNELVVCGVAIGRPDPANPVNRVRTERATVAETARFYGFED